VGFHRSSRTLITSDLLVNVEEDSPPLTRFVFRMLGSYRKPGWGPLERRCSFAIEGRCAKLSIACSHGTSNGSCSRMAG
jgi:hypothetical protein